MRAAVAYALMLALVAGPGAAQLPESSPRPVPRPALPGAEAPAVVSRAADMRPMVRNEAEAPVSVQALAGMARSVRPEPRPAIPYTVASISGAGMRSQPSSVMTAKGGAICGDPGIRGQAVAPIPGRIKGCGIDNPVKVTAVDGVPLTRPATIDCTTAKALKSWVANGVKPVVGRSGGGVASIRIVADYACRTRNNQPGAKVSEHGRGRAVDVAAVNLRNGAALTVLGGWNDPAQGKLLRQMHRAACGPFGTVLGPQSDRFHQDHFHLDTARYRSGTYCR